MKRSVVVAIALFALTSSATAQNAGDPPKLQKALSGRTAGTAQDCITLRRLKGQQSFESDSILFRLQGGALYRNDASGACKKIGNGRSIILDDPSGRLCKGDVVSVVDMRTGHDFGVCRLGAFTPYTKS